MSRFLSKLYQIFNDFTLFGPRFLQYLTVNLKVFAYCSELLGKPFRSFQSAPKMPPRALLDPLLKPEGAPWSYKLLLKSPQETPKVSKRTSMWSQRLRQGVPKGSQDVPEGFQVLPEGSLRNAQRCPRESQGSQGISKGSQGVPKGSPRDPQGVPKGSQRVPKGDRATTESVE